MNWLHPRTGTPIELGRPRHLPRNHFRPAAKHSGNIGSLGCGAINTGRAIMWRFIIGLIYHQSCQQYLADVTRHHHRWI
jgi:hypothetical protein